MPPERNEYLSQNACKCRFLTNAGHVLPPLHALVRRSGYHHTADRHEGTYPGGKNRREVRYRWHKSTVEA